MKSDVQISAEVSQGTRDLLDRVSRQSGVRKGRIIEDALHAYLLAMETIPQEFRVPARIVVSRETGEQLIHVINSPAPDTPAMKRLKQRRKKSNADKATSSGR
jgi:hypothetical protein